MIASFALSCAEYSSCIRSQPPQLPKYSHGGEIRVTVLNTDAEQPFSIEVGDRIAQLIIMPVARARFVPVTTLPGRHRGESGFGSTGLRSADSTHEGVTS